MKQVRLERDESWILRKQLNEIKEKSELIDWAVGWDRRQTKRFMLTLVILFIFVYASLFGGYYYGRRQEHKRVDNFQLMAHRLASNSCSFLGYGEYVNVELQEDSETKNKEVVLKCELRSVVLK